jgi:Protein of unknown function (DUF1302)
MNTIATRKEKGSVILAAAAMLLAEALFAFPVQATEIPPGERPKDPAWTLDLGPSTMLKLNKATITYGTLIRARGRDPELLPPGNSARVGLSGTAPGGVNVDDGNLNYGKGAHLSTALKGLVDIELTHTNDFRAFVRAKAWDDYAQRRDSVPHGNFPNGYIANTPLSDRGFSRYGEFSGAALMDAYVEGIFPLGPKPLMVRVGSQPIPWGNQDTTILGGLEQINAIDYATRHRAVAVNRDEGYIPVPAIFVRWGPREGTAIEAFYLFKYQQNELPGCGTFFALNDYATQQGCDRVLAQPTTVSDPAAIAAGLFARRAPDVTPSDSGQFGVAFKYLVENVGQFGAYFSNYHSRRFSPSAIKSPRLILGATPLIPGDPGGENVRYFVEYPEDIRVFGLTYGAVVPDGRWKGTRLYAEYTYRPNQSLLLGSTDLFNAFASNVLPTQLRADATATPPGGIYHGYDRLKISEFKAAGGAPFGKMLGGHLQVSGEAGFKYIHDLPDVNVRRYGRSDVYGLGPVNGVCPPGATPKQCSNDGFVTAFSWGYRAKASITYTGIMNGVNLTPSVAFQHDVNGTAHDIAFIDGRKAANVAIRADIFKKLFVEASWTPIWGGDYNFMKDRDFYSLVAGLTF